jgi:hypothetical protein
MERAISQRHWRFALFITRASLDRGGSLSGLPCDIESYLKTYPAAKSRNGAHASCRRLLNHPNVFAARQWLSATMNGEVSRDLPKPHPRAKSGMSGATTVTSGPDPGATVAGFTDEDECRTPVVTTPCLGDLDCRVATFVATKHPSGR